MTGLQAQGLYDLKRAVAQSDLPVSVGLPLSQRLWVATATISHMTAQGSEAITPKPVEGVSVQGGPHLSIPQSKEEAITAVMELLRINVGYTKWVYCCHVEGCTEGPSTSQVAICSHMHQAYLGTKLSCPSCLQTFLNIDTLQHNGKQAHPSGSSYPV